jgi:hypothetical protein
MAKGLYPNVKLFGMTRDEMQKAYEDGTWTPPSDIVDVLFDMAESLEGEFG